MTRHGRLYAALISILVLLTVRPHSAAAKAPALTTEVELSTKDIGAKETALGDLIADALHGSATCDAAFFPASSITDSTITIAKGSFTTADVLKTLEYGGDDIVIMKLTGDQIRRGLEHGLYLYPKTNSGYLQTSGMVVTANPSNDTDKRVISVKINGDTLVADKTYKVAMPEPLANGALAYFSIWKKTDMLKDTTTTLQVAITSYLTGHPTVSKGEDRLVIKGK